MRTPLFVMALSIAAAHAQPWTVVELIANSTDSWIAYREIQIISRGSRVSPCAAYTSSTYEDFTIPDPQNWGAIGKALDGNTATAWNSGAYSATVTLILCGEYKMDGIRVMMHGGEDIRVEHIFRVNGVRWDGSKGPRRVKANAWLYLRTNKKERRKP